MVAPTLPPASTSQSISSPTQVISQVTELNPSCVLTSGNGIVVSGNGNIYSSSMFPLDPNLDVQAAQMKAISELEAQFPTERLKMHTFEWNSKHNEWLPIFEEFWKPGGGSPTSIAQIWEEYTIGMGNPRSFSIEELTNRWCGRWKRNIQKIKTEASKRKRVVELIQTLSAQTNWTASTALKFLDERYPIPSSSLPFLKNLSAFIAHLQKKHSLQEIIVSASSYPISSN